MAELPRFICPYCSDEDYIAPSQCLLLTHVRLVHSLDPNFSIQCNKDGCSRRFKNFRTYQNHCAMHDRSLSALGNEESSTDTYPTDPGSEHALVTPSDAHNPPPTLPSSASEMKPYIAKWILKTSETRSLTRVATLGIVHDVSDLVEFITQALKQQTQHVLGTSGVEQTTISAIDEVFSNCVTKPFEDLKSFHQHLQYFRNNFRLIVSYY